MSPEWKLVHFAERVPRDADEPVRPGLEACGERVKIVEAGRLRSVAGDDGIPGCDLGQLVRIEDGRAFAKKPYAVVAAAIDPKPPLAL